MFTIGLLPCAPFAATFAPVTIEDKIVDSDLVVFGKVLRKYYTQHTNGKIVTAIMLQVAKAYQSEEMLSTKREQSPLLTFYYPGGKIKGMVSRVDGTPRFRDGEEVAILLREVNGDFWAHHLAAGKFSKVVEKGRELFVSDIFPNEPNVGYSPTKKLERILKKRQFKIVPPKSSSLHQKKQKKKVAQEKKSQQTDQEIKVQQTPSRQVAQVGPKKPQRNLPMALLIFVVALMSGVYFFVARGRRQKRK